MASHADQQGSGSDLGDDLHNRFMFHPATEVTGPMHEQVRDRCYELAAWLRDFIPQGRHSALAMTSIEEAMHWANAAIACDTTEHT